MVGAYFALSCCVGFASACLGVVDSVVGPPPLILVGSLGLRLWDGSGSLLVVAVLAGRWLSWVSPGYRLAGAIVLPGSTVVSTVSFFVAAITFVSGCLSIAMVVRVSVMVFRLASAASSLVACANDKVSRMAIGSERCFEVESVGLLSVMLSEVQNDLVTVGVSQVDLISFGRALHLFLVGSWLKLPVGRLGAARRKELAAAASVESLLGQLFEGNCCGLPVEWANRLGLGD